MGTCLLSVLLPSSEANLCVASGDHVQPIQSQELYGVWALARLVEMPLWGYDALNLQKLPPTACLQLKISSPQQTSSAQSCKTVSGPGSVRLGLSTGWVLLLSLSSLSFFLFSLCLSPVICSLTLIPLGTSGPFRPSLTLAVASTSVQPLLFVSLA